MRIGSEGWYRRFVIGTGGFLGEVTLESLPQRHPALEKFGPRCIGLTNLFVHPLRRGSGWAHRLMQAATKYADSNQLTLVLMVVPHGAYVGPNESSLMKFYAGYGFKLLPYTVGLDMVRRAA